MEKKELQIYAVLAPNQLLSHKPRNIAKEKFCLTSPYERREEIESPREDEHCEDEGKEEDEDDEHDAKLDPTGPFLNMLLCLWQYPHRMWTNDAAAIYSPKPKAKRPKRKTERENPQSLGGKLKPCQETFYLPSCQKFTHRCYASIFSRLLRVLSQTAHHFWAQLKLSVGLFSLGLKLAATVFRTRSCLFQIKEIVEDRSRAILTRKQRKSDNHGR